MVDFLKPFRMSFYINNLLGQTVIRSTVSNSIIVIEKKRKIAINRMEFISVVNSYRPPCYRGSYCQKKKKLNVKRLEKKFVTFETWTPLSSFQNIHFIGIA